MISDNKKLNSIKSEIIKYGTLMGKKNYTPGYSGNISARFEDKILITTTGSANGYLEDSDFTVIDYCGIPVNSELKPSSEKKLHIEFYKMRKDINYIIHVHPPYLSSFASAKKDLLSPVMAENVFYFKGIPLAEYALPSSDELVKNTSKYFKEYDAVLMANHGFIVGSYSLRDAYMKLELAEQYAQVVMNTYIIGGPNILTKEQAQEILALRH